MSCFGHIPYGHKMDGRLLFDLKNTLGCDKFNREAREDPFVMVYEGEYDYFTKNNKLLYYKNN